MKPALLGLVCAVLLLMTPPAWGAPRIVLLAPNEEDATTETEDERFIATARRRLQSELTASGFDVISVSAAGTGRSSVDAAARQHDAFAAIFLGRVEGEPLVDVWISDRLTNKTVVRSLELEPDDPQSSSTMALRVVELLQASLIELDIAPQRRPPPKEVQQLVVSARGQQTQGWWLSVGPSVAGSWGQRLGLGLQLAGSYRFESGLSAGLSARGPFWGSDLVAPAGRAAVTDGLVTLDLQLRRRHGAFGFLLGAGLGAYGASIIGQGAEGFVGRRSFIVSPAADLHAGGLWAVSAKTELSFETFAGAISSPLVVRLADVERGPFALPLLGLSLNVATRL